MEVKYKFKGIHFSKLTTEQIDSMSQEEFVKKTISDEVDEVIKYHDKMIFMKKNMFGSFFILTLCTIMFGYVGLIAFPASVFFSFMYNKRKNNFKWSVRALKSMLSLNYTIDDFHIKYGSIVREELGRINHIHIGDFYR